eukprot:TRINITY_DN22745_c0_g1_i1.p1 TRINITY_DN22745_c0_g1~~TRINITY_DN22745_c0_g1_i1.p1  ORF type:complete len:137 (+),score=2.46 TRINITY_DN22745_c0_g1_i1:111-521(+)
MIRRPPRSTQGVSSAASDVYKRQTKMSLRFLNKHCLVVVNYILHSLYYMSNFINFFNARSSFSKHYEMLQVFLSSLTEIVLAYFDKHRNDFYNDQFLFLGTAITYISILFSILTILLYISPFFPIFILNSWNYMGD